MMYSSYVSRLPSRYLIHSFEASTFLLNFQMPMNRGVSVSCRPFGPARVRWWLIPSAGTSLGCLATMEPLTGLWIQPALPCWIDSLLLASDHDSTSGSMQSRYIFLYHSIVCAVAGELILTVLPSLSTSMPPNDHSTGPAVEMES